MSKSHKNGYNSSGGQSVSYEEEQTEKGESKVQSYIAKLIEERNQLRKSGINLQNADRLLELEIQNAKQSNKPYRDFRYVDVYREKQIRVIVKVSVPIKEHPKFNFVGKLLGPSGNSFRHLQEETLCKMAILGRGSMKDKDKEEELRNSCDPKYAHLNEDLHVEVSALGPPAEAHARIAYALAEVRKFLIPDANDTIRQEQFRELMSAQGHEEERPVKSKVPPYKMQASTPGEHRTVMPAKTKIMSILDRARVAMEESYGYEEAYPPTTEYYETRYPKYEYAPSDYYPHEATHYAPPTPTWKSSSGYHAHGHSSHHSHSHSTSRRTERYRHEPYTKPSYK